jgi:YVTN family beta-propeller protein
VSPDGSTAFVTNSGSNTVSVVDLRLWKVVQTIEVGGGPVSVAFTPDGHTAYVSNFQSSTISVIDALTRSVTAPPISLNTKPGSIRVSPDGSAVYVGSPTGHAIYVIDTRTNQLSGERIALETGPSGMAVTPDGRKLLVSSWGEGGRVLAVNTATRAVEANSIQVGVEPGAIAITPDQSPVAALSYSPTRIRPDQPVTFDASNSRGQNSTIAGYVWDFGDGGANTTATPAARHRYAKPGSYPMSLRVIDSNGCSAGPNFTGSTAYCAGSSGALKTASLLVSYPGVHVACPGGDSKPCRIKLQAVDRKDRGSATSAVAQLKLRPGDAAIATIRPRPRFARRLSSAKKILVREKIRSGKTGETLIRQLKVVR